jgi:hypothetical protein
MFPFKHVHVAYAMFYLFHEMLSMLIIKVFGELIYVNLFKCLINQFFMNKSDPIFVLLNWYEVCAMK